jgi:hypothetical protein
MHARSIATLALFALTSSALAGCIVRSQPAYYVQPQPTVYYTRPAPRVYYTQPAVVVAQPVARPVTTTVIYR